MSSAPHVDRFKGSGWEECHEFIIAIRARALWEGKQRDPASIADFAAPLFWRKALSWHGRLPQDVRQDWFKLEAALFDRWPEPEDDDEPQIEPTPAAAPSLGFNNKSDRQLQGVLKVVVGTANNILYLKFPDGSTICSLTTDASEAIRVHCSSLSSTTVLERIDHLANSWLAVQWSSSNCKIETGSYHYSFLALVDMFTLESSLAGAGAFQLLRCNVLNTGEIVPVWRKDDGTEVTLFPFVIGSSFYIGADREACARIYGDDRKRSCPLSAPTKVHGFQLDSFGPGYSYYILDKTYSHVEVAV